MTVKDRRTGQQTINGNIRINRNINPVLLTYCRFIDYNR